MVKTTKHLRIHLDKAIRGTRYAIEATVKATRGAAKLSRLDCHSSEEEKVFEYRAGALFKFLVWTIFGTASLLYKPSLEIRRNIDKDAQQTVLHAWQNERNALPRGFLSQ